MNRYVKSAGKGIAILLSVFIGILLVGGFCMLVGVGLFHLTGSIDIAVLLTVIMILICIGAIVGVLQEIT
jgi:hypothetical protein